MTGSKAMMITDTGTTDQRAELGELYIDKAGNHYRYMQADGAVTSYDVYSYVPGTWQIDAVADATVNPADAHLVALCVWDGSATALADNEYAWVFVGPGLFTADTDATGVAGANDEISVSATAGKLSSGATAALVPGVHTTAAITGLATGTFYATLPLYTVDTA
jgi:hypothetical protein